MRDYEGMFVIYGDLYQYDPKLGVITLDQDPLKKYTLNNLDFESDLYSGLYNTTKKEIISTRDYPIGTTLPGIYEAFSIPLNMLTEEFRNSEKLIQAYNKNCISVKHNFQYVGKELSSRMNGIPAEIRIDGISYIVDLKKLEISQKDNPEHKFIFPLKAIYNPTELYYDTQSKKPVILSNRITESPEHVICYVFPNLKSLDPIGYSQLCGYPPYWLVSSFEWNPKNVIVPWKGLDKTPIPELVRRNQMEQEFPSKKNSPIKSSFRL